MSLFSILLLLMVFCWWSIFLRLGRRLSFWLLFFLAIAFLLVLARRMRAGLWLLLRLLRLFVCRLFKFFMFDRLLLDLGLRFLLLRMRRRVRTLCLFCGFSFLSLFVFFLWLFSLWLGLLCLRLRMMMLLNRSINFLLPFSLYLLLFVNLFLAFLFLFQ